MMNSSPRPRFAPVMIQSGILTFYFEKSSGMRERIEEGMIFV